MIRTYRIAGWLIAGATIVQAAVMVFAVAGLFAYLGGGGTVSVTTAPDVFPESVGITIHILLAYYFFPIAGLGVVVIAAFTKRRLAIWMAALLFALILLEWYLGVTGYSAPVAGLLHGANGLIIFGLAVMIGLGLFTRAQIATEITTAAATTAVTRR